MHIFRTFALVVAVVTVPTLTLAADWQTYSAPVDGFSIDVPTTFTVQSLQDADAPDNLMRLYQVVDRADPAGTAVYMVGAAQANAPLPELADADFRGYAGSVKCTLSGLANRTLDGYPAIEATCAGTGGTGGSLLDEVEAHGYSYMLASSGPAGHETSPAALKFRDSLVLLPPATPAPQPPG
jgi:hypothetical protein